MPRPSQLGQGAEGVVEGEEPGLDLLDGEARDRAGEPGREDRPLAALRVLGHDQPVAEREPGLQAVGEAGAQRRRHRHPVHHHLDIVLALLVEGGRRVDVVGLAVDLDPGEAALEQFRRAPSGTRPCGPGSPARAGRGACPRPSPGCGRPSGSRSGSRSAAPSPASRARRCGRRAGADSRRSR